MVLTDRKGSREWNDGKKRKGGTLMEKENWIRQVSRHNLKSSGRISIPVREITIRVDRGGTEGGNRGESQLGISRIKSRVVLLAVRGPPHLLAGGKALLCIVTRYT